MNHPKYSVIYIDPPWAFSNKNTGGGMKSGADAHYPTMTAAEMAEINLPAIAADDCVLFMWWVASQPREALHLVDAWGFKIKTMTGFTWVKQTKTKKLHFGMGFWTRAGAECCLIATRGKPKPISHSVRSVALEPTTTHSAKPAEFAQRIELLCGDVPRVEVFARQSTPGWDSIGNGINGMDIRQELGVIQE